MYSVRLPCRRERDLGPVPRGLSGLKLLLDSCVTPRVVKLLEESGHDVNWVGNWEADPGDTAILNFATRDSWTIVTIDKDFGDLIHLGKSRPCSVIRLVGFRAAAQGPAIASLVDRYASELSEGALITSEPWRVRVRRLGGFFDPIRK